MFWKKKIEGEYAKLCTFLETLLTHLWYATNVATLSRRTRDSIEAAFEKSVDDDMSFLVESRLHDFGFRGATGVEAGKQQKKEKKKEKKKKNKKKKKKYRFCRF